MWMPFAYPLNEAEKRIAVLGDQLAARLSQNLAPHDREWSFTPKNLEALHQSGYLRLGLPREYGGEGADVFDMVLAQERLARGDPASALVVGMMLNVLGRLRDDLTWPREVYAEVCREIAAHGGGVNSCATEADLGSVSRGGVPAATATPADGGWCINGKKIFVTGAPGLRYFVTLVRLPPNAQSPHGEVGSAIVEANATGLLLQDAWRGALSLITVGNYDVTYESVFVRDAWIVERRPVPSAAERQSPNAGRPKRRRGAYGQGKRRASGRGRSLSPPSISVWLGRLSGRRGLRKRADSLGAGHDRRGAACPAMDRPNGDRNRRGAGAAVRDGAALA
jgi:alkylation response protein AidB-like acyl-CoA dehydrogenase